MPVAAVPQYLQRHLTERNYAAASPALRFGLLLPIWTVREDQEAEVNKMAEAKSKKGAEIQAALKAHGMDNVLAELLRRDQLPGLWEKNDHGARTAWQKVTALSADDKARMKALADRQKALWQKVHTAQALRLEAKAIAPFTTGLGNEHPLENGFAFLNPYGLPYLPGSGVKGVLRQAARELASGKWGDTRGWNSESRYDWPLEGGSVPPLKLSMLDVLFGRETDEGEQEHFRGALTFWDVIPQIAGDSLMVEIMTPHYAHYYAPGRRPQDPVVSPHDSGQPNPICFLTVPPGSDFVFHVTCDTLHLASVAPDLAEDGRWKQLLEAAFRHAFRWLGFGAKTAVGYGVMKMGAASVPPQRGLVAPEHRETAVQPPDRPTASKVWQGATLRYNPADRTITAALGNQRSAPLRGQQAEDLLRALGEERANALRNRRSLANVNLRIEEEGNLIKLIGLDE